MKRISFLLSALLLLVVGCKKIAGEGGNSRISGKIIVENRLVLTNPATIQFVVPAADEEVFIVYDDHISPDDKVLTNYDGFFEFRNLRKGDYTIYVYSNDTTGDGDILDNKMPIISEVSISKKNWFYDLGNLRIYED